MFFVPFDEAAKGRESGDPSGRKLAQRKLADYTSRKDSKDEKDGRHGQAKGTTTHRKPSAHHVKKSNSRDDSAQALPRTRVAGRDHLEEKESDMPHRGNRSLDCVRS